MCRKELDLNARSVCGPKTVCHVDSALDVPSLSIKEKRIIRAARLGPYTVPPEDSRLRTSGVSVKGRKAVEGAVEKLSRPPQRICMRMDQARAVLPRGRPKKEGALSNSEGTSCLHLESE